MKLPKTKGRRRGASILLMSIVFMAVLFLMSVAMYRLIPSEFHAANRSHQDLEAHYVAEGGVRLATSWLVDSMKRFETTGDPQVLPDYDSDGNLDTPPDNIRDITAYWNSESTASLYKNPEWRTKIDIKVDPTTVNYAHNFQPRVFEVTSTAYYRGKPIRTVTAWVRQSTFASFAYFTKEFLGEMRINGKLGFDGPVHTNDYFVFNVLSSDYLDPTKSTPYFKDQVSFSSFFSDAGGDGNKWLGANKPYDADGPKAGAYQAIFEGGRNSLRSKSEINLPTTSDDLKQSAFGNTVSPFPTTPGVYISDHNNDGILDAGIYVKGDVQELFMGLDEQGNQRMAFKESYLTGDTNTTYGAWEGTITPATYGPWQNYVPPQWNGYWECPVPQVWVDPPPPQGGGMGEAPTGSWQCPVPQVWKNTTQKQWRETLTPQVDNRVWNPNAIASQSADYDLFDTIVVEAETASTFKYNNAVVKYPAGHEKAGQDITVARGETLLVKMQQNTEVSNNWVVAEVQIKKGMPNGTIFIDGNIKGTNAGDDGLSGIAKGSPATNPDGTLKTKLGIDNITQETTYNNKVIGTPLDKSVALSGDLLQFDPQRFKDFGSKAALDDNRDTRQLKNVALNPNNAEKPELSTKSDHILGIVTQDAWMKGKKVSHARNGNDGFNDVYAVILAGRNHPNGKVSGGFGTHSQQVNSTNGGGNMGKFRIMGGVIQGTTGQNQNSDASTKHFWTNPVATHGYQVEMFYDRVATYQRFFPTYAQFEVIRYLERSARDSTY